MAHSDAVSTTTYEGDEDEAFRNLDMLQQMILEHEMEMEKHKLELEQLKQLWQDRVRQVGSSDRP